MLSTYAEYSLDLRSTALASKGTYRSTPLVSGRWCSFLDPVQIQFLVPYNLSALQRASLKRQAPLRDYPAKGRVLKILAMALKFLLRALKILLRALKILLRVLMKIPAMALKFLLRALKILLRALKFLLRALEILARALKILLRALMILLQQLQWQGPA